MSGLGARRWWAVSALVLATVAVGFDITILNLALPAMAAELDASTMELQWFVAAYTLVFAAGMIPAGMLGDRYGRKKVMITALVIFGLSSLACAYAPSSGTFIGARAVLGLGAALIMPTALAMMPTLFAEEKRRKAIGVVAGAAMLAYPIGPIIGGWLLNHFWWGAVFLINLPVVVLAIFAVTAWLPESRSDQAKRIDVAGVVVSCLGLAALSYGVIRAGEDGWSDPAALGAMITGVLLVALFVLWEKRVAEPLVDLGLFRSAGFNSGTLLGTVVNFTMYGVLFVVPQYFQAVLGADAMGSGVRLLPLIVGMLVGLSLADTLAKAMGPKASVGLGLTLLAVGLFVGAGTDSGSGTGFASLWTALYGLGLGLALPAAMDAALGSLPKDSAGVGSGVNQAIRTVGGSFGAAILGSVLNAGYRGELDMPAGLPPEAAEAARESVFGGLAVATRLAATDLVGSVRGAFVHALDLVLLISGALGLVGVLIALLWLPREKSSRRVPVGPGASGNAESQHEPAI